MSVILSTQEAEIRRIVFRSQPGQKVCETLSGKTFHKKIGLVEWLKLKALSSSPSTNNNNKNDVNALLSSFPITFPNCF
jgi:hypothetical protein